MSTTTKISRRSAHIYGEEAEKNQENQNLEARRETSQVPVTIDERDSNREQRTTERGSRSSTNSVERRPAFLDIGSDLGEFGQKITEDMVKQVTQSLQPANDMLEERACGRPVNFGTVITSSIYRSSFPVVEDFEYLRTLGLKTIVSLVRKDFDPTFTSFMSTNGINHVVINMEGTKKVPIPESTMHSIMEVALDKRNQPLLIHCNHGKHRTGCTVAVIRLVAGWDIKDIISEYKGHAEPKVRDCDLDYIRAFKTSTLKGLFPKELEPACVPLRTSKIVKHVLIVSLTWLCICSWSLWTVTKTDDGYGY